MMSGEGVMPGREEVLSLRRHVGLFVPSSFHVPTNELNTSEFELHRIR
jgi:hypothetical protein